MALPRDGSLDRLVTAVAAKNPKTIVVNSTGSPITMPWLNHVSAVLQAWFPGQEAGYSIADIILGSAYPGGKLPMTFPRALSDTPAFESFPGDLKANFVEYKEGIYIGYRHYDRKPDTVLFPFGFGLSYKTFDINNVSISAKSLGKGRTMEVNALITTTGVRPGSKIVQVYVGPGNEGTVDRPLKELKGFAKVHLSPGARQRIFVSLEADSFAYFNEKTGKWAVDTGEYTIFVGVSSAQIISTKKVEISASFELDA